MDIYILNTDFYQIVDELIKHEYCYYFLYNSLMMRQEMKRLSTVLQQIGGSECIT